MGRMNSDPATASKPQVSDAAADQVVLTRPELKCELADRRFGSNHASRDIDVCNAWMGPQPCRKRFCRVRESVSAGRDQRTVRRDFRLVKIARHYRCTELGRRSRWLRNLTHARGENERDREP